MTREEMTAYIRHIGDDYTRRMKNCAAREAEAVHDHERIGARAGKTYCEGALSVITDIMAYTGDGDGLRMVQAERESA
jgi:hypothetical protein